MAIDSFKIRASNSLKNNLNESKLKRHLAYIDEQIDQYQARLDACNDMEHVKYFKIVKAIFGLEPMYMTL